MPWTVEDVDKHNKGLSLEQKKQWVAVANAALKRCKEKGGKDCDAHAIRQANAVVARKSECVEFSLNICKAYFDEATQEMRWRAVTSDTLADSYSDEMSLELFNDFISRIESKEKPPEHFCSDYWSGGMPYLSVSHYRDQNGKGVPGVVDAVYIDGNCLKARGRYSNTPLGKACFDAVCESLHNKPEKPVRVSIAFLDYKHEHKSNGVIFARKSEDVCKECLQEMLDKISDGKDPDGKRYLSGHLIHFAHTRVPINKRTLMEVDRSMTTQLEDAASIVGEELAKELAEKEKELVGKSEAIIDDGLVIKAVESKQESEAEEVDEAISARKDVNPKTGEHKYGDVAFADEKNKKYPIDTEEHIRAAWNYINKPKNAGEYSSDEVAQIKRKIIAAWKSKIDKEGPPSAQEKSEYELLEEKVDKVLSILEAPKESAPVHPLAETLAQFMRDFDSVMLSDATVEEKLHALQAPINAVGEVVISVVKAESKPVSEEKQEADKISRMEEMLAGLSQKLELISTQLSTVQVKPEGALAAPPRRNIPAPLPESLIAKKSQSITPSLRALIEKSVQ